MKIRSHYFRVIETKCEDKFTIQHFNYDFKHIIGYDFMK